MATRDEVASVLELVLGVALPSGVNILRSDVPAWDSIKHIEVVFALEEAFNTSFSEADMAKLDSIDVIARVLSASRTP